MSIPCKPSDGALLKAIQTGDLSSLSILFERYRVPLYVLALRLLGSRAEAEDALQETFLIAVRKLHQVSEPEAVGGWLHRVVRNVCRMRLRTSDREFVPEEWFPHLIWSEIEDSVEEHVERLALRDWVWEALHQLPETLRVTAMLRYFSKPSSYTGIAAILGVPVGTVRSRLNQAKIRLTEALLQGVSLPQSENRRLTQERTLEYAAAFDQMNQRVGYEQYIATFSDGLRLILPNRRVWGLNLWMDDCEEMLRAGVKIHLSNLMLSGDILVLELILQSPPDDPFHCPPATTQVHFQRDRQTHLMRPYFYSLQGEQVHNFHGSEREVS